MYDKLYKFYNIQRILAPSSSIFSKESGCSTAGLLTSRHTAVVVAVLQGGVVDQSRATGAEVAVADRVAVAVDGGAGTERGKTRPIFIAQSCSADWEIKESI